MGNSLVLKRRHRYTKKPRKTTPDVLITPDPRWKTATHAGPPSDLIHWAICPELDRIASPRGGQ